jgi:hypothetical protein
MLMWAWRDLRMLLTIFIRPGEVAWGPTVDLRGVPRSLRRDGSSGRKVAAMAMGSQSGQLIPPLTVPMARARSPRCTAAM